MSGHSKWSSIKHKKAANDAKRGKIFTKLIREITVLARMGGGDPAGNPRLRTAISAAKAAQMPAANIERGIKKGTGEGDGAEYIELTYEGYGAGGIAVILETLTDNKNRTVADIRHAFSKHGGNMGEANSVKWMFDRVGHVLLEAAAELEEKVFEVAVEAGADDVEAEDEGILVTTPVDALEDVRAALEGEGFKIQSIEVALVAKNTVPLTGSDAAKALRLVEALDDLDDVQRVSANFDINVDELNELSA